MAENTPSEPGQVMLPRDIITELDIPLRQIIKRMNIYCNDNLLVVDAGQNLISLLEKKKLKEQKGIAVAVNNTVISRNNWDSYKLQENDKVLIISATKGG